MHYVEEANQSAMFFAVCAIPYHPLHCARNLQINNNIKLYYKIEKFNLIYNNILMQKSNKLLRISKKLTELSKTKIMVDRQVGTKRWAKQLISEIKKEANK